MTARRELISVPHSDLAAWAEVFLVESNDGTQLRAARWTPKNNRRNVTVLLCHGFTEFIEKYYEVIEELLERGFSVVTFDWRGQGLSAGRANERQRGYVTSFDHFVDDARSVIEQLCPPTGGEPLWIVAHSMGGNVALRLLQEHPTRFARAVLCAPMVGWDWLPLGLLYRVADWQVRRGRGQSYIWGGRDSDGKTHLFRVSSDQARIDRWQAICRREPDLLLGSPSWLWMREAARSTAMIHRSERMAEIRCPVLLASAGRDKVVSSAKQHELAAKSDNIELVDFPRAMHEILHEIDEIRRRFWASFDEFANQAITPERRGNPST